MFHVRTECDAWKNDDDADDARCSKSSTNEQQFMLGCMAACTITCAHNSWAHTHEIHKTYDARTYAQHTYIKIRACFFYFILLPCSVSAFSSILSYTGMVVVALACTSSFCCCCCASFSNGCRTCVAVHAIATRHLKKVWLYARSGNAQRGAQRPNVLGRLRWC